MSTLGHFTMATRRVGLDLVVRCSFVTDRPVYSAVLDLHITEFLGATGSDDQRADARERAFKWLAEQEHEVEVRRGIPVGYRVGMAFTCVACSVPLHATTPATPATTMFAPSRLVGGTPSSGELHCDSCGCTVEADIRRSTRK